MFSSCHRRSKVYNHITYESNLLEDKVPEKLKLEEINTNYPITEPKQMTIVRDSLLVIFDRAKNGKIAHIVNVNGSYLNSFGEHGSGKGKMVFPKGFSIEDDKIIYFYDYTKMNTVCFDIDSVLCNYNNPKTLDIPKIIGGTDISYVYHFSEKDFIVFGYDDNCRIANVQNNKIISNYTEYPSVCDNDEYSWSVWTNMANYMVSPNKKYIVITTRIGALFEIFEHNKNSITSKLLKAIKKPVFDIAKGAKPACVIFNNKTYGGFGAAFLTDNRFYGVIDGFAPSFSENNAIYEFDFKGNVVNKYVTDNKILTFLVAKNNEIYAITRDGENRMSLKKGKLCSIDKTLK